MNPLQPALALLLGTSVALADTSSLEAEAWELSSRFMARLKPELQSAMADGGPAHAIEICASQAPQIADALSAESGWLVRRVSLKQRNASRAVPDDWERRVLEDFDQRQAAGEEAASLVHAETVGGNFRYLRAQAVAPVCLVCHGEQRSPDIAATLKTFYPDDIAVGYSLGQVRGAISLSKPL